jgi:uncharacterized damage-inducible protein DinB
MNTDYFRTIFAYNYARHDKLWECIAHLTDEQYTRDSAYSVGSIRNHMVHLASVDARWLARIEGTPPPEGLMYEDFPTAQATNLVYEGVKSKVLAYVNGLADSDLGRVITYDIPQRGGMKHDILAHILGHMVNHGTDHRARVLAMLHSLGAPTFEQDLMIYLWGQA